MRDTGGLGHFIPEETMLVRLAQSEQMRDFFMQMWLQNPQLARNIGHRVQNLLSPLPDDVNAGCDKASAAGESGESWANRS